MSALPAPRLPAHRRISDPALCQAIQRLAGFAHRAGTDELWQLDWDSRLGRRLSREGLLSWLDGLRREGAIEGSDATGWRCL